MYSSSFKFKCNAGMEVVSTVSVVHMRHVATQAFIVHIHLTYMIRSPPTLQDIETQLAQLRKIRKQMKSVAWSNFLRNLKEYATVHLSKSFSCMKNNHHEAQADAAKWEIEQLRKQLEASEA